MIEEEYISFEVAKLLKDKGFNEKCNYYFISNNEIALTFNKRDFNHGIYLSAPTQYIVMRWLREVHNLSVEVYRTACGYIGCITAIPSGTDIKFLETDGDDLASGAYTKWEYACEAAIKYCLEHLI